jgi:prevent-host-death family protein
MAARTGKGKTGAGKRRGARKEQGARKPGDPPAPAVVRETAVLPAGAVPAGVFKATCLELMDRVRDRREEIVITKYGKPVAKLVPVNDADAPKGTAWGWMKGTVLWYGDVISPIDVEWEAMKD